MEHALVKAEMRYGADVSCYLTFTQNTLFPHTDRDFFFFKKKQVTSMEHALVKAEMRYGGDVSCLCALVRQRIVFDSFHDQLRCLRVMADGVEFLKSRLLRDYL